MRAGWYGGKVACFDFDSSVPIRDAILVQSRAGQRKGPGGVNGPVLFGAHIGFL